MGFDYRLVGGNTNIEIVKRKGMGVGVKCHRACPCLVMWVTEKDLV